MSQRRSACVLAILIALLGACASWPGFLPGMRRSTGFTEIELRENLLDFAARFSSAVSRTGDRIVELDPRSEVRRRVLLWKVHLVPLVQQGALRDDPQEAYIEVLTLVIMMRQYLAEGDGREIFGVQQAIAVEAAEELESEVIEIGRKFIEPDHLEQLRAEVAEVTRRRAISGRDFSVAAFQSTAREIRATGSFDWVIDLPLSPFRALEGVGSGAAAIHDFNDTALRFSHIVEGLPNQLRWQAELLAFQLETIESVTATRAALQSFAQSAERITLVTERYPEDLGRLLGDSEATLAEARGLLTQAQALAAPLRDVAEQLNQASSTWATLLASREPGDPTGRPFDVREWESAARAVGEGAAQLEALAAELREIGESPALAAALGSGADGAAARLEERGRSVVDHASWRVLQLLLVLFALLLVYRFASRWIARPER